MYGYSGSVEQFICKDKYTILGHLNDADTSGARLQTQESAWEGQIDIMKETLNAVPKESYSGRGRIYFERKIPRLGGRIDVVLLLGNVIFVIEFKVGAKKFKAADMEQVSDYALDLKNFHEGSHAAMVVPILVATKAPPRDSAFKVTEWDDSLIAPIAVNSDTLSKKIEEVLAHAKNSPDLDHDKWERSGYRPTPTIVEAARALYANHRVAEIAHKGALNLQKTSSIIDRIIATAEREKHKAICFVTGVPGSGKTLVGLNAAISPEEQGIAKRGFLSGNRPLVKVLRKALEIDKIKRDQKNARISKEDKSKIRSALKGLIQLVHNFRDSQLGDLIEFKRGKVTLKQHLKKMKMPSEHVAVFDEAQRAWNKTQLKGFMAGRPKVKDFSISEPEFLIACFDRHEWAVIVCLVGGGQEITTGEAGISAWLEAIDSDEFSDWHVYVPAQLKDSEYNAKEALASLEARTNVVPENGLHLSTSMRSFRAENVSLLVKQLLDLDDEKARQTLREINLKKYPIVLTRDVHRAKQWLKKQACGRGSERCGLLVSSKARRLRPHAIDVRHRIKPVEWFLRDKDDVRSSHYLEDAATEFDVQGLEIDWGMVIWDADLRHNGEKWLYRSFKGSKWQKIEKDWRQAYQKNAYRVLLTRARQGMVIVVPEGDPNDPTRKSEFYDHTYKYLKSIGFKPPE